MDTTKGRIISIIESWGSGSAFTAKDFTDLAPRGTVDVTLLRLAEDRKIRKLGRGLFDYIWSNSSTVASLRRKAPARKEPLPR